MKKYLVLSLMFLVLSFGTVAVFAENSNANTNASVSANASPMMLNIGPSGNVMLRGKVVSVGTDSLVVKSWGGSWTVKVDSSTKIMSTNKLFSDFKADDFVGVKGSISEDGNFVINAKILREWGQKLDADKDGIPDNQDNDKDNNGKPDTEDAKTGDHGNLNLNGNLNVNLGAGHTGEGN